MHNILNASSKVRLQYFFNSEKIKKQNAFPWKSEKVLKGPLFHRQKYVD